METSYDIMTYNGSFAEVAKHDEKGGISFQLVFYGVLNRGDNGNLRIEEIGDEPMPMTGMYMQSIDGATAANAFHRGSMTMDEIEAIDGNVTNPAFMQSPFGLEALQDINEYIEYSHSLSGSYDGLRDPWQHAEEMRTKTRKDFQFVLSMIDRSPRTERDPQGVIDLLELELEFSEVLATDYGLREEVYEIVAAMQAKLAENTTD